MDKYFQTIIIGGGPGGLIAGSYLEDALIIEQKKEIGKPIQCIGISTKALERQGLKPDRFWAKSIINKIERVMPNGKILGRVKEPFAYIVEKRSFEKFLSKDIKAKLMLNQKVSDLFFKNDRWNVKTKSGEFFQSKYVIAADGFDSVVRKTLFPEFEGGIDLSFGLEYVLEFSKKIDPRIIRMYFDNKFFKNGYGWIFPTSDLSANVGVGGSDNNLSKLMDEFLDRKIINDYGKFRLLNKSFGVTASRKNNFPFFKSNVFLVGDAAGFNDPLFKAGTNQAMISARLAAECIINNKVNDYNKKISSLPFAKQISKKNSDIFYSLDNEILEALGDMLEGRGFSYLNRPNYLAKLFTNKTTRKDIIKLLYFFIIWNRNKKWLW